MADETVKAVAEQAVAAVVSDAPKVVAAVQAAIVEAPKVAATAENTAKVDVAAVKTDATNILAQATTLEAAAQTTVEADATKAKADVVAVEAAVTTAEKQVSTDAGKVVADVKSVVTNVESSVITKQRALILQLEAAFEKKKQELVAIEQVAVKNAGAVLTIAKAYATKEMNAIESAVAAERMKLHSLEQSAIADVEKEASGVWIAIRTFYRNIKTLFSKEI